MMPGSPILLLLAHAFATLYMTGLAWFVQVVHYPLLSAVGRETFVHYENGHTRLTTLVVAPPMLLELACALALVAVRPPGVPLAWLLVGLGLLGVLWISTALWQIPLHLTLGKGFDEKAWRKLVATNWLRTAIWSARAVLAMWWLWLAIRPQ